jgi:polyhydroxybutyrate depolymerase
MAERGSGDPLRGWFATALIAVVVALVASACSSSASSSSAPTTATTSAALSTSHATTSPAPSTSTATSPASPTTTAACAPKPHAAGQFSQTFEFQGVARTYQLYVPRAYTGNANVPLVFDFHGFGSNAVQQMAYGNFKPLADRNDFLIVAPDGQGQSRHFNLSGEQGLQNDVAMVMALLDHIEATFCVDPARVYSTGMSDGGAMTSVLACVASNRFAAFGPVAVQIAPPSCGTHPVAMVAFHGTADPIVPYNGGRVNCCGGAILGSTPKAMATWAEHDRCSPTFTDTRLGTEVERRQWSGCAGTSAVVLYSIEGGGHTWPGSIAIASLGMTTHQIDASATIWSFFAAHPLVNG